jgi:hypothetical protein
LASARILPGSTFFWLSQAQCCSFFEY